MDESLLNELLEREANQALAYFNEAAKGSEALRARVGEELQNTLRVQMATFTNDNERKRVIESERIETAKQKALEV